ncbi:uncharacterized protein LOC131961642 isoform X2 [Centropristis striata]|uniref:uncharacterized protein LOC131961642 isoform X2 n=1 Tax=Centropristis striata TaxID=184440 RepID=UPI0027E11165|nr:uncharacterized protein LOC131961642 isoform X2 [Centropristis striata]
MECKEKSPSYFPQCSAGSAMGRRNAEVKSLEPSSDMLELTVEVKTSKPIELSSCFCEDSEACMCKNGLFDSLCLSPATAAAQTQMPSTKPKARTLVACRQLTDGNEAASLKDQSPLSLLTLTGTVSLAGADPKKTSLLQTSITGKASVSAAEQHEAQSRRSSNISREGNKSQYYRDLRQQVEERKQQMERERSRNAVDEQKHMETMLHSVWGMPGSGAPNFHLGTVKRTNSLCTAGILPQEQHATNFPVSSLSIF